jgi:hypothetical protein
VGTVLLCEDACEACHSDFCARGNYTHGPHVRPSVRLLIGVPKNSWRFTVTLGVVGGGGRRSERRANLLLANPVVWIVLNTARVRKTGS